MTAAQPMARSARRRNSSSCDPLVRVEGEQPVRTMVEGGGDEVTAVGGLVHSSDGRPACGSGRQRADGGKLGASVRGAVVDAMTPSTCPARLSR